MQPVAYGEFETRADSKGQHYNLRTETYIQWGKRINSIGAVLMCNPGSAELITGSDGEVTLDPTMKQLCCIVDVIYRSKVPSGRLYIYNLFPIQEPKKDRAIKLFNEAIKEKVITISELRPSVNEVSQHPWFLVGWGCLPKKNPDLTFLKNDWLSKIDSIRIPSLKIPCRSSEGDFLHPRPQLHSQQISYVAEIEKQSNKLGLAQ